ncbi:MAG: adenylosuccinate lyase [Bacillota bacterium]
MISRYTRPEMGRIWTPENKFEKWLDVELYACEAWAELGRIPREAVEALKARRFPIDAEFVRRGGGIEKTTRHDVIAFITALAERMGPEARYIHYGLTSTDVVDTAQAVLLVEAVDLIIDGARALTEVLARRAVEFKDTPCIGRTHGVHAEPTTFGLKLALWYAEMQRNLERLQFARRQIAVGKLSGAVGNFGNSEPFVEEYVCRKLGLEPAPISTQVLQRDRHAELITTLAILAGTLEKIALEVRLLQRTEGREVEEPFSQGQKGSSAMPHKRNPVGAEQIVGLARVLRGNVVPALENMALWHERDISHSSVERVILPDSTILADYLLHRTRWLVENLQVYPENMLRVMDATGGLIYSGRVLLALVEKGLGREEAYAVVQRNAMAAWGGPVPFRELIARDPEVAARLTPEELDACFDYRHNLRHVDTIFRRLGLIP